MWFLHIFGLCVMGPEATPSKPLQASLWQIQGRSYGKK